MKYYYNQQIENFLKCPNYKHLTVLLQNHSNFIKYSFSLS